MDGRKITDGSLNATYQITLAGRPAFVRERLVRDQEYGQVFAGERHLPSSITSALRVPALRQIVAERFAVFEWVDGAPPDWTNPEVLDALAAALVTIHCHTGDDLGDLGRDRRKVPVAGFLAELLATEHRRLPKKLRARLRMPDTAEEFCDEAIRLCHGDVHPGNFLWRDGELWVLDWEAARFRVAAADFNQLHHSWLDDAGQRRVLDRYCALTGRDAGPFLRQVRILRALWHLRTFNFHTLVLGANPAAYRQHLEAAESFLL